ncbi:MAG: hypothetical protein O7B25_16860 [Gammaproteobacteria bacterium]|nr:hypothetical protein [Gammaproteobacteria bacterium]
MSTVNPLEAYVGELVLVDGFIYQILRLEVRDREIRCIAYSDDLERETDLSVGDLLSSLIAETPQPSSDTLRAAVR